MGGLRRCYNNELLKKEMVLSLTESVGHEGRVEEDDGDGDSFMG